MNTLAHASPLHTLQQQISNHVRLGTDGAAALIVETPQVSRETRLGIYSDAYIARLNEAIQANFPKLHQMLGDDECFELTRRYALAHPSRQRSIRWFGHRLAEYLNQDEDYAAVPVLAELAGLEWALAKAFDAANTPPLTVDVLTTLDDATWPVMRLVFHPAVSVLPMGWNAIALWKAIDAGEEPPKPEPAAGAWIVWREGLSPHFRSLAPNLAALLQAAYAGQPFATACEALLPWHSEDDAPGIAAGYLGQWLRDGWIVAIEG